MPGGRRERILGERHGGRVEVRHAVVVRVDEPHRTSVGSDLQVLEHRTARRDLFTESLVVYQVAGRKIERQQTRAAKFWFFPRQF